MSAAASAFTPDLQDLTDTAGLGHNNPAQKIQYHLRLKLQLEQMRHQCILLLKDRFRLEQCVRCWPRLFTCCAGWPDQRDSLSPVTVAGYLGPCCQVGRQARAKT